MPLKHDLSIASNSIGKLIVTDIPFYFLFCVKRNSLALEIRSTLWGRRMRVDRQTLFAANTVAGILINRAKARLPFTRIKKKKKPQKNLASFFSQIRTGEEIHGSMG